MAAWYPKRTHYFMPSGDVTEQDDSEQGDIFWGVPTLVARHPELADNFQAPFTPIPPAEDFDVPPLSRVLSGVSVHADAVMVLPHTCDFYGLEKGRANRARLVARVERLAASGIAEPRLVRTGNGYNHTFSCHHGLIQSVTPTICS